VCRRGNQPSISAAGQRLDGCQLESLLIVHLPSLVSSHARELQPRVGPPGRRSVPPRLG
jgi:hypothetical protein